MKHPTRALWLARFDIEPLLSATLRNGMVISLSLIAASLAVLWFGKNPGDFGPPLHAQSIPALILADLSLTSSPAFWPMLLVHLGVAVLLLTPYARLVITLLYFMFVEPSWKRALFTGSVLVILTLILFTNLM